MTAAAPATVASRTSCQVPTWTTVLSPSCFAVAITAAMVARSTVGIERPP
ncbi:MAG: hypothetical protein R2909_13950 [Gemmatimonadales bacterium]